MRIGFDFRLGGSINAGIGRYSFELLRAMLDQSTGDQFVVFYNADNVDEKDLTELENKGAELVSTTIGHYSFAEQLLLPRLLQKYNLDLVHFPNFNVPIFYKGNFVVTIHDMVHHKISGQKKSRAWRFYAYKYIIDKAAERAQKIITITEAAKKDIVDYLHVPEEKIVVTYEAPANHDLGHVDLAATKKKFLIDKPYFLFAGTLERKKNIPVLAKGFDVFLSKYRFDMDLVIAGKVDKFYPEVKDQALDISHRDHLIFTGYVTDEDQAALYQGAYAFTTASLHEGFGLPALEAMRYGIPVLAANTEVFNEVYDNAAMYFDPNDPEDIADKMRLIASDAPFYEQMQLKSVARVVLFDWNTTAEQTLVVYHSVFSKTFEPEQ